MLKILKSLEGMYGCSLTTADFPGFCKSLGERKIPFWQGDHPEGLCYRFTIRRRDKKAVSALAEKRGDELELKKLPGLYWNFQRFLRRPVLAAGVGALILLFLLLPTRVLFIEVRGNEGVETARILEAAAESGLKFGMSRRAVRSEQVKNGLLYRIPELKWAGVNGFGCVVRLNVAEEPKKTEEKHSVSGTSLVAVRDGIVEKCQVLRGQLLCREGQAVKKGQVLISGSRKLGENTVTGPAEGEVFGLTVHDFSTVSPEKYLSRGKKGKVFRKVSLILGKKRIKIYGTSGNLPGVCGRMYKEYYMGLPGGFRLPVALTVDTYWESALTDAKQDPRQIPGELEAWAGVCLQKQMIAGRVLKKREQYLCENGVCMLKGTYLCHEMMGRIRKEQIGEQQDLWNES